VLQHHESGQEIDWEARQLEPEVLHVPKKPPEREQRWNSQPEEQLIKTMMAEISQNTSNNVKGEIFCL
jgi:hypothetical protein